MLSENSVVGILGLAIGVSSSAVALYVRLSVMELRAEFRVEISDIKDEIIKHINASYVKKESCGLREGAMQGILDRLRYDIDRDAKRRDVTNGL